MSNKKITQICNLTNMLLKYNWHLNLINNEITINLKQQNIKKY